MIPPTFSSVVFRILQPTCKVLALMLAVLVFGSHSPAEAQVLYRQVFGRAVDDANIGASYVNWATYRTSSGTLSDAGARFGATIRNANSAPTSAPAVDPAVFGGNVNSSLAAAATATGIAYVFTDSSSGTLFIPNATEQTAFGTINYSTIPQLEFSWYERRGGAGTYTFRLAVQVGSTWLVTGSIASAASQTVFTYHSIDFTTDTDFWFPLAFTPGTELSIGSQTLEDAEIAFPMGNITNFGFLVDGPGVTAAVFDSFTVTAIPEPGTFALGVLSLPLFARRRSRVR